MGATTGKFLKFDHVFKPAKHVQSGGTRSMVCTAIAMNELQQVMGYWHMASASLYDIQDELRGLFVRSEQAGQVCPFTCRWLARYAPLAGQVCSLSHCWPGVFP